MPDTSECEHVCLGFFLWDLGRLFSEAQERVTDGVHFVPRSAERKMLQISIQTTACKQTNVGFAYSIWLKTPNQKPEYIKNRTLWSQMPAIQ